MRFSCSRSRLREALNIVGSLVPQRSTKPILQNIRFEGRENNLIDLSATDLDVGIRYTLEVDELVEPESVVLSHRLSDLVRDAWGDSVAVEIKNARGKLITENGEFELLGEADDDFPEIPSLDESKAIQVRAEDLQRAIARTHFATAKEEAQYSLAGIYIVIENKQLEMVATDTFRLALARCPLREASSETQTAIVLPKGMHELQRMLADQEMVSLQITDSQFFAQTAQATLVSRLIEGKFPQYRNVMPTDLSRKITVDRVRLTEALRQVAHVSNEETHAVNLVAHDELLEINAASTQRGDGHVEMAAECEGGEVTATFNYSYLIDVLRVLDEEKVSLQLRDRESPARIDAKDYTYVLSPVCARGGS